MRSNQEFNPDLRESERKDGLIEMLKRQLDQLCLVTSGETRSHVRHFDESAKQSGRSCFECSLCDGSVAVFTLWCSHPPSLPHGPALRQQEQGKANTTHTHTQDAV